MAEKNTPSDKRAATEGAPPAAAGAAPALIPVKELWFNRDVFVPGRKMTSGCKTTEASTGTYWRVLFDRVLRHHRIEHYEPSKGNTVERPPSSVRYYPESWASWEPLT